MDAASQAGRCLPDRPRVQQPEPPAQGPGAQQHQPRGGDAALARGAQPDDRHGQHRPQQQPAAGQPHAGGERAAGGGTAGTGRGHCSHPPAAAVLRADVPGGGGPRAQVHGGGTLPALPRKRAPPATNSSSLPHIGPVGRLQKGLGLLHLGSFGTLSRPSGQQHPSAQAHLRSALSWPRSRVPLAAVLRAMPGTYT